MLHQQRLSSVSNTIYIYNMDNVNSVTAKSTISMLARKVELYTALVIYFHNII